MKYSSKSILLYKTILNNNYKCLWGVSYNKINYRIIIFNLLFLHKYIKDILNYNSIFDTLYINSNNNIIIINKIIIKNKLINNLNLIKYILNLIFKIVLYKIKKYLFKIYFLKSFINLFIFKNYFSSIQYILKIIQDELTLKTPIRKIFYKIYYNLFYNYNKYTGIKIIISGRINKVEKAYYEKFIFGKLYFQTIKIPILYTSGIYNTNYGILGIKLWVSISL